MATVEKAGFTAQRQPHWGFIFLTIFIVAALTAGYFALQLRRSASPPPANFLAAEKGYGVTVDLTQYDNNTLADTLAALDRSGLTWLRQPIIWADIEPTPGQFNWSKLDRAVGQAVSLSPQTKLIAVLHTTPAWARPAATPPTTPPTEVSDFGRFARALAERYGDQLDYYQIWHEPNLSANWGNAFVDPGAYADLLREAAVNIRAADLQAVILTAALAPTLENGPLNLNELAYLDQLYQAKANRWFDVVAGQAYGFDAEAGDPARPDALNFRRLELLREVMLAHGDAETPIWATAFGWNALPADWSGQPSPWQSDTAETQAQRTAEAIALARRNWPWLGPLLAIRWDSTGLPADDPARGFAIQETPPVLAALQTAASLPPVATSGRYPADHPSGHYSDGWRFASATADIPRDEPRTLTIPFEGTRLDLTVNRGSFRGYLWVTIDGQAANALPQDEQGRSYVVLYDLLRESESLTLARHLSPGPHEALIEAEGGWGQWAIGGWTVYNEADTRPAQTGLTIAGLLAGLSGLVCLAWLVRAPAAVARLAWAWAEILVALYAILGERGQIIATFGLAITFYLTPGWGAVVLLLLLALALLARPDLGLALIAFSLSFFQAYKPLPFGSVSPVELALALTLAGFIFRGFLSWGRTRYAPSSSNSHPSSSILHLLSSIFYPLSSDLPALTLVVLAFASTLAAENFGVSMREWRVLVLESVIFYFLVRLGLDFNPTADRRPIRQAQGRPETGQTITSRPPTPNLQPPTWAWRLIDAFVAGATLQALIALYLYFFTDQSITAEGVRRALGLAYGSPNNLSLFLDRAWPILLAVTFWPRQLRMIPGNSGELRRTQENLAFPSIPTSSSEFPSSRRWLYGVGLLIVSVALYLTFSKGALLLGLPVGLLAMGLFYLRRSGGTERRQWQPVLLATLAGLIVLALALIPLSQTERFRTTFDFNQGSTGFFRLKLWQASLTMLADHWPLGVGLDNFLYQYRTRYILPDAWQEPNLSHPHNLILDFGTRLGIGGIALLLWLQVAFWRSAWRLYRRSPGPLLLGLMGSMVVFLAHGLVDNSYFLVDLAFIFFLMIGIVQRLRERYT
ncbi:MAG: O-antigen ligase family protein [Anaerolineae bacterium]|nr:O-antigen ligase family protein [Anaerolineae bacterium]